MNWSSQAAEGLRRLDAELLERLKYFALAPHYILDLGAGVCHASLLLREHFPRAHVLAADISVATLLQAPRSLWPRARFHRVAGDAKRLPLADHSVDLVYSNLLLPFCAAPDRVFREVARVLKAGGLFMFSSFGPDSLVELATAWRHLGEDPPVRPFLNLPQLGEVLMHSGLVEPVLDTEEHRLFYPDVHTLLDELRHGARRQEIAHRPRRPIGRARLRRLIDAYEAMRIDAGIPATFEIIVGAAFASGDERGNQVRQPDGVAIPVSSIKKHVR